MNSKNGKTPNRLPEPASVFIRVSRPHAARGQVGRRDVVVFTFYCRFCPMVLDTVQPDKAWAGNEARALNWHHQNQSWVCPLCWHEGKRVPPLDAGERETQPRLRFRDRP